MMNLENTLTEKWPFRRIVVECEDCGVELVDTAKEEPLMWKPSYLSRYIKMIVGKHQDELGHDNINIELEMQAEIIENIDETITVSK